MEGICQWAMLLVVSIMAEDPLKRGVFASLVLPPFEICVLTMKRYLNAVCRLDILFVVFILDKGVLTVHKDYKTVMVYELSVPRLMGAPRAHATSYGISTLLVASSIIRIMLDRSFIDQC